MAEKEKKSWYPLAEMLELHSPAAVATAIEESGILVVNRYGGKATAEDSSKDDIYSKQYALELVAERFGELENPGPEKSWEAERWETEQHPTYRFGWYEGALPNFEEEGAVDPVVQVDWAKRSAEVFIAEYKTTKSFTTAAGLHGVSRQRYTRAYKKVVGE